ncbi:MAG: ATPase, T2SS/T4P/T4SS family, partial [Patescibacteria group bacterium]
MKISPRQFIGKLIEEHVIDQQEAEKIEIDALNKNLPIFEYLLKYSSVKKEQLLKIQSEFLHVPFVDIASSAIDPQALNFIPESVSRMYSVLPYAYDSKTNSIYVASNDPLNFNLNDFLEKKTGKRVILALADVEGIVRGINMSYAHGLSPEVKEALAEVTGSRSLKQEKETTVIKEAPIAKIVDTILEFAMKGRASDIHIEPEETKTRIRYRIDGVLQEKLTLPRSIHDSLISRIKILSEMKIDERRIPQDGRFSFKIGEQEVDLRVSTLPTVHGEKVVMRLLKKTGGLPLLSELGLTGTQFKDLEEAIS